jgi:hypothetical protein
VFPKKNSQRVKVHKSNIIFPSLQPT